MTSQFFDAIFFDMDGLTINSEPQWLEAEIELAARYGYAWTQADQANCLGGPLSKVGEYFSNITDGAESGPYFHQEIIRIMTERISKGADFMPGAKELLNELDQAHVPLALVSASPRAIVDAALSHVQPTPFSVTISADDVLITKPNPECYLKAAELLSVNIQRCLILEDSKTGVAAARASGAKVLAVPHLVKIETDHQTRVINSLTGMTMDHLRSYFDNWF